MQHELCEDCHDGGSGDNYHDDDDDDAWLIESKVDSDCIDFGSRVHHQDEFPDSLFYNPYDMFMPRVKELVSIVVASKAAESVDYRSRKLSTTLFLLKRQTLHLRNHHPLVEWCHHALLAK